MCRSIKTLRRTDTPVSEAEVRAAALQFIRKVSGYRTPSAKNRDAFDRAVDGVTATSEELLAALGVAFEEPASVG